MFNPLLFRFIMNTKIEFSISIRTRTLFYISFQAHFPITNAKKNRMLYFAVAYALHVQISSPKPLKIF